MKRRDLVEISCCMYHFQRAYKRMSTPDIMQIILKYGVDEDMKGKTHLFQTDPDI